MNKGETEYYKVIRTLGKVKICGMPKNEIAGTQFGMKITKVDENQNYGTHKFYDIELIYQTYIQDIDLGNKGVSYVVKSKTEYLSSYNTYTNTVTMSYADSCGEIHELKFNCPARMEYASGELLNYLMTVIVFIEKLNDHHLIQDLCTLLFDQYRTCGIGRNIEVIKYTKDLLPEIKDKYPFTAPLIDQGIDRRKQQIMNELYNAALLDKPAT